MLVWSMEWVTALPPQILLITYKDFSWMEDMFQRTCMGQQSVYSVTGCTTTTFHTERNTELTQGKLQTREHNREWGTRREDTSHLGRGHREERSRVKCWVGGVVLRSSWGCRDPLSVSFLWLVIGQTS